MGTRRKKKTTATSGKTPPIALKISLTAPALLADGPAAGNLTETLDFIPGSALRGLLAWHFRDTTEPQTNARDPFQDLFQSPAVRFLPATAEGALPIPTTAHTCKRHPGFMADAAHGVVDLLEHACARPDNESPSLAVPRCGCGAPLQPIHGFMATTEPRRLVKVSKRMVMHTAVDPRRGSAATNQLFGHRVLNAGQHFLTSIECLATPKNRLTPLIGDGITATIGRGATRGLGWVRIEPVKSVPKPYIKDLQQRYNRYVQTFAHPLLVVDLLTDTWLLDQYLRDRLTVQLDDLEPFGINPDDWKSEPIAISERRDIFGFDGRPIGLPRPVRATIASGSVFAFRGKSDKWPPQPPPGTGVNWIGENNGEGLGRVLLWSDFHLQHRLAPA